MTAPGFWQAYFIAGALWSLSVLYRRSFVGRYRKFAAGKLARTARGPRIITGCIAVAICIVIWPLLAIPPIIIGSIGFVAGALYQLFGRRK